MQAERNATTRTASPLKPLLRYALMALACVPAGAHADTLRIAGTVDTHGLRHSVALNLAGATPAVAARARTIRAQRSGTRPWWSSSTATMAVLQGRMGTAETAAFERDKGYPPIGLPVGLAAVVVVVHPDNPLAGEPIAVDTLRRLAGKPEFGERRLRFWGDLGATRSWLRRQVNVIVSDDAPVIALLRATALDGAPLDNFVTRHDGPPRSLVDAVARRDTGLGIVRLHAPIRSGAVLPLRLADDAAPVAATVTAVQSGRYPLAECVYAYLDVAPGGSPDAGVGAALALLLDDAGQALVSAHDILPLGSALLNDVRSWLSSARTAAATAPPPCPI